jgi:hypothetical protein
MTTERQTTGLTTDDIAQPEPVPAAADVEATTAGTDTEAVTADNGSDLQAGRRETDAPLVEGGDEEGFRHRWEGIQAGFVDEPRAAVEQADALVAELMQRLAETFSNERKSLEGQWDRGEDVSTEDLRVALTRYRSFFDRLLAT